MGSRLRISQGGQVCHCLAASVKCESASSEAMTHRARVGELQEQVDRLTTVAGH